MEKLGISWKYTGRIWNSIIMWIWETGRFYFFFARFRMFVPSLLIWGPLKLSCDKSVVVLLGKLTFIQFLEKRTHKFPICCMVPTLFYCTYVHVYIYILYIHIYIHIYTHTYTHTYTYTYTFTYTYTYRYRCRYRYTYTYTYKYKYKYI